MNFRENDNNNGNNNDDRNQRKGPPNPQNFKIVKCKYWENGNFFII